MVHVFSHCYNKYHWVANQRQAYKKYHITISNHTLVFISKNATSDQQNQC